MATATYIPIATQTLGSAAASITFNSIPGTYTDLCLTLVGTTVSATNLTIQVNSDSGFNYSSVSLSGDGASATSYNTTVQSSINLANLGSSSTVPAFWSVDFFSYAGATNKTILAKYAGDFNGSGNANLTVGLWQSTSAINSIKILAGVGNLNTGFVATLWGI